MHHKVQLSVYLILVWSHLSYAAAGTDVLNSNERLLPGQHLVSENGKYKLALQEDGNLVLYYVGDIPIWASNTSGRGDVRELIMQSDGNLVIYLHNGNAIWASGTNGRPETYLKVQNDGNMLIYHRHMPVWITGTQGKAEKILGIEDSGPSTSGMIRELVAGIFPPIAFIKGIVGAIRGASREAKFIRHPLEDRVALIKWTDPNNNLKYGFVHFKSIGSFGNDYMMLAADAGDARKIEQAINNINGSSVDFMINVNRLARDDRFKRLDKLRELGWHEKFSQDHAVALGKGSVITFKLNYAGNNIEYKVDLSNLDNNLRQGASAWKADKSKWPLSSFWYRVALGNVQANQPMPGPIPGFGTRAELYLYLPDLIVKYLK